MARRLGDTSWLEANQSFLVAEFGRLRSRLDRNLAPEGPTAEPGPVEMTEPPAINRLKDLFGLSDFERDTLLLCAGVEMDARLAALCAEAQGHAQRSYVTFGLATATLPDPHWSALAPSRPLRRLRLIDVDPGHGLSAAPLRIDERILHYLAGVNVLDARMEPILQPYPAQEWIADSHRDAAARFSRTLRWTPPPVIQLSGDDPDGQLDAAAHAVQEGGWRLFIVHEAELPPLGPELNQFILLWEREARLLSATLLLRRSSGALSGAARHAAERLAGPLFLSSAEADRLDRPSLRFDVNKPPPAEQKRLWRRALGPRSETLDGALNDLSEQFRLSAKAIFANGAFAESEKAPLDGAGLWDACRALARPKLENLAQRIIPAAGWDDLVLPEQQLQTLRQLADQVRHRMQVYETWGFSDKGRRGLGVTALFAGESGTGKTLAAEVLARELKLDLYRIDLSQLVSKWIGESAKNMKQVFDAGEEGGVLLLFDEADALFGKRSEVKDSHDRYANIDVGYLLQRMETFQGLAILTTNLKSSLDRSFQRRLRFTVTFPFPDATQREAIWDRIFPGKASTSGLQPKRLAQLNMTGGNIRNIGLNAAFLAATAGQPIRMPHILRAAQTEADKIERPLADSEIRGWV
jgi:ATPase family associated with various cellular activities (AAA)